MTFTQLITFLLIGIGLSFDSFAVSVSCGLIKREIRFWRATVFAGSLAFFQALFPAIGWFVGTYVHMLIAAVDHWVAFILFVLLGVKMIIEGKKPEGVLTSFNPFKLSVLIGLSTATSLDAMVVGLSFGVLEMPLFFPIIVIGLVTFIASMLGVLFGKKVPSKRSRQSLILGGIILISIGIKIIVEEHWFHI